MQRPAVPADTNPDNANDVVRNTDKPPSVSKFSNSQRFVIQKLYHICALVSRKASPELVSDAYLSFQVYFQVKTIEEAALGRESTDGDNPFE